MSPTDLTIRLAELKAVAEKATPGVWRSVPDQKGRLFAIDSDDDYITLHNTVTTHDATHIATFSPPTVLALIAALEGVMALHRRAHAVFSWQTGSRYEDPCPDCDGKAGVHDCGCWADSDIEYVCAECHRLGPRPPGVYDYTHPCPTIKAITEALGVER